MNNANMHLFLCMIMSFATASLMGSASSLTDDEPVSRVPMLRALALGQVADSVIATKLRAPKKSPFNAAIDKVLNVIYLPSFRGQSSREKEQCLREKIAADLALRENIQEEDLWDIIEKVGVRGHLKGCVYDRLAEAVAKDYFLRLTTKEGNFRHNYDLLPDRLPAWLQCNFKGVTIQDLLNYGLTITYSIRPDADELNLRRTQINDLSGLEHIPNKRWVHDMNLASNKIETIPESVFADFEKYEMS